MKKPVIAIIGRPNVGKSTLVNRIVGKRKAIVDDMPGVTRDRSYYNAEWLGREFVLIDTGGLVPDKHSPDSDKRFSDLINAQVALALEEADVVILVVDGQSGLMPDDEAVADLVRKSRKPVFVAVNKIDQKEQTVLASEFYSLGFERLMPLSAMHGNVGVGDLLEKVVADFPERRETENPDAIRISILGRPNVGKSSILNALLGTERSIVSDVSGTTRDAIDAALTHQGQDYVIVDTAGIRRKSKVGYGVELFSVDRALRSLDESDIAVIVLDATESQDSEYKEFITDQDKKIMEAAIEAGKGVVVVINKWDAIPEKSTVSVEEFRQTLLAAAPHIRHMPLVFVSAKTGQRLTKILDTAKTVHENWSRRHSTSLVNQVLSEAFLLNPPPIQKSRQLKLLYATQAGTRPPTFVLFTNDAKLMKDHYKRYLENKLRESFELAGCPVVLVIRSRDEK